MFAFLLGFFLSVRPAAIDPQQLYAQSADALYNLDFNIAEQGFETLRHDHPENPEYWNALASSIWFHILYQQQKLNVDTFSGRSLGTEGSHDTINPADEKRFRDLVASAIQKADLILQKNPNDVRALYAKGIANATLASFEATARHSYLTALGNVKTAHGLLQDVLNLDPSFDDARAALGTFNYALSVVPLGIRVVLSLWGLRGDGKETGIKQLETAASSGGHASTDARMVLIVVYNREKRYDQSLRVANELHTKYPRNFLFELAEASIYKKMKRWDDAAQTYQKVLTKAETKKDGYDRLRLASVHYLTGLNDLDAYQFGRAVEDFSKVTVGPDATPDEKARAHIGIGKILDTAKDRAGALAHYDAVLALNCSVELKNEAQRYKRRPFGS